jgi:hypothetical protein
LRFFNEWLGRNFLRFEFAGAGEGAGELVDGDEGLGRLAEWITVFWNCGTVARSALKLASGEKRRGGSGRRSRVI